MMKIDADKCHKRLLQNKQTLALVLKSCCPEFQDLSLAEVVKRIEPSRKSACVRGENNEINGDVSKVVLDTLTTVDLGSAPMLVNVEVQAKRNPGYCLENREIYYVARIVSIEKDRGYVNTYNRLLKVYSIWLMTDPPKKLAGDIDMKFLMEKRFKKDGTIEVLADDPVKSKICLVKVYLPEGDPNLTDGNPINILGVLFRNRKCADKTKFMKDNGIPIDKDLDEALMQVRTMEDVIRDDYRRIYEQELDAKVQAQIRKEKANTAKGLLEEGIPVSVIQKVTKLSVAAINRIAQSLQTSAAPTAVA